MILELKNIEKSFGEKKVLTGVSFKAEGGKALIRERIITQGRQPVICILTFFVVIKSFSHKFPSENSKNTVNNTHTDACQTA